MTNNPISSSTISTNNQPKRNATTLYTIHPLRIRPFFLRLDTFPFALSYILLIYFDLHSSREEVKKVINVTFPMVLFTQLALFLATKWSVAIRAKVGYTNRRSFMLSKIHNNNNNDDDDSSSSRKVKEMEKWTHALVIPPSSTGSIEIVPVTRFYKEADGEMVRGCSIEFQHLVFRCCVEDEDEDMDNIWKTTKEKEIKTVKIVEEPPSNTMDRSSTSPQKEVTTTSIFHPLHYPIDFPLPFYSAWIGHTTSSSLSNTTLIYSTNTTFISLPSFTSLLSEQLLAPFFLFQLLCVFLWSLDEYWYYAIFTLFTLILFECTVSYNRLKNVQRLRETLRSSFDIWVYREKKWCILKSNEIVTGDIVSLSSGVESALNIGLNQVMMRKRGSSRRRRDKHNHEVGRHVPADLLLLQGSAVVNEAMLTGESVPQIKECLDTLQDENGGMSRLDMEDAMYKKSILFGGTVLVNHDAKRGANANYGEKKKNETIPPPPDQGCICFTLRTGFDTQQGQLLRTMIHAAKTGSQNDGINTIDTFLFILLLLTCAVVSAVSVLQAGWNDPTRNKFRLVLHVIIIVTSVVPPELPMELSLAVTSSLADLMKRCKVYCTEPFRIPLAGKVNVCCFDKTGTLTSDEMRLRGVRLPAFKKKGGERGVMPCLDGSKHGSNEDLVLPTNNAINEDEENNDEAAHDIPRETLRVMVGCQSLASTTGGSSSTDVITAEDIIGDPLEKAVLLGCKWMLRSSNTVYPTSIPSNASTTTLNYLKPITVYHRFAFSSKLKRMTVLARDAQCRDIWALTKGAPETLYSLLEPSTIPCNYEEVYKYHMGLGQRVLCMAYRNFGGFSSSSSSMDISDLREKGRGYVEQHLIFGGFLVLDCPLKSDSFRIIKELKGSCHEAVMITGDSVLTAAEVARQVGIIGTVPKDTYELRKVVRRQEEPNETRKDEEEEKENDVAFEFVPMDSNDDGHLSDRCIAYKSSNYTTLEEMVQKEEIALCVSGETLIEFAMAAVRRKRHEDSSSATTAASNPSIHAKTVFHEMAAREALKSLVTIVSVFARHAPRQKEAVIAAYNDAGRYTLMCGDGTNDVGALKQAHVGISIVSVPDLEAKQRSAEEEISKIKAEEKKERKALKKKQKKAAKDGLTESKNSLTSSHADKKRRKKARAGNLEKTLRQLAEAEEELSYVALGDASVASPFTSRAMSIRCCKDVLQQGRCTLVTMIQIYKILGVNCLVNALVLTKLHTHGVKQGDRQLTVVGMVVAAMFLFVTKGKPLSTLAPQRPPSTVLCRQVLLSISVQFAIHFVAIMSATALSLSYVDPYDPSIIPDGAFNPNTLNTCTFLLTVMATINTFVVNYRGRPFTEDLTENLLMLRSLQISYAVLFACALEIFPPLNELMQLAPLPTPEVVEAMSANIIENDNVFLSNVVEMLGFKVALCIFMILDGMLSYAAEKTIVRLFEG